MLVYVYRAALYCEACGEKIRAELSAKGEAPPDPEDEYTYDSDDFPKGPTEEGESDSPSHCDACDLFLESDLTSEGRDYVRECVTMSVAEGRRDSIALTEWAPFYGIDLKGGPFPG